MASLIGFAKRPWLQFSSRIDEMVIYLCVVLSNIEGALAGALFITLPIAGSKMYLMPQKAAFLPESATLLIADVHLAKGATFIRAGMPLFPDDLVVDLSRLSNLISAVACKRIIFLGDLFHHYSGIGKHETMMIRDWRSSHADKEMLLISGNHDRGTTQLQKDLNIDSHDSLLENGLFFTHYPETKNGYYNLAGHIHPVLITNGKARQRKKLPCFYIGKEGGILPAFGLLTGGGVLDDSYPGRYFVCSTKKVSEILSVK